MLEHRSLLSRYSRLNSESEAIRASDQNVRLEANLDSRSYWLLKALCDVHLVLAQLKINPNNCVLTAYNSIDSFRSSNSRIQTKTERSFSRRSAILKIIAQLSYTLLILYMAIKVLYIVALKFEYDRLMKYWAPQVRQNSTIGSTQLQNGCARPSDIYFASREDQNINDRMQRYKRQYNYIGYPIVSVRGITSNYAGWLGYITFIYFAMGFLYIKFFEDNNCQLKNLLFMFNPLEAKQQCRNELNKIISDLMSKLSNYSLENLHAIQIDLSRASGGEKSQSLRLSNSHFYSNFHAIKLTKLLFKIQFSDLVRPLNLNTSLHSWLIGANITVLLLIDIVGYLMSIATLLGMSAIELHHRVLHRLQLLECIKLDANSTLIRDHIQLSELTSVKDMELYRNHDNSWQSLIQLVLVEARLFYNFRIVLSLIESLTLTFVGALNIALYAFFFFSYNLDKTIWIYQIQRQMDECRSLMTQLLGLQASKPTSKAKYSLMEPNSELEQECELKLTVAYLNFELFRREHKDRRRLINFLLFQATLITIESLVLCFVVAKYLNAQYTFVILAQASLVFAMMNIFIISSTLFELLVERVMKQALNLVTTSCRIESLRGAIVVDLWRRQLLDVKEIRRIYAPGAFGIRVTADKLVTVNTWLVILYYVIMTNV